MYKVGQRFTTNYRPESYSGCVFEIIKVSPLESYPYSVRITNTNNKNKIGDMHSWRDDGGGDMLIINDNNYKNMSIKEKFVIAFLKEPEKSFRKAGITNGDGMLTAEGQEVFLTYLLSKNGEAFKTDVVDGLLKDEESCKS